VQSAGVVVVVVNWWLLKPLTMSMRYENRSMCMMERCSYCSLVLVVHIESIESHSLLFTLFSHRYQTISGRSETDNKQTHTKLYHYCCFVSVSTMQECAVRKQASGFRPRALQFQRHSGSTIKRSPIHTRPL
jgi:hypothetical protein